MPHYAHVTNHTKLTPALCITILKRILISNELGVWNFSTCNIINVIHSLSFMRLVLLHRIWNVGGWTGSIWLRIGSLVGTWNVVMTHQFH